MPKDDAISECLVCGKIFPRGALDLARHQNAITLKHITSLKPTSTHQKQCENCQLYFSSDEHLSMHHTSIMCIKKRSCEVEVEMTYNIEEKDCSSNIEKRVVPVDAYYNIVSKRTKRLKLLVPSGNN